MNTRKKANMNHIGTMSIFSEGQYPDMESDLKHMNGIGLNDSEVEFLSMKRLKMRKNSYSSYAPDPRLGDYEA